MRRVDHFLANAVGVGPDRFADIFDPSTGEVQAQLRMGDRTVVDVAVKNALAVQPKWAATNPQKRARVMFRFKELIEQNKDDLAQLLSSELGKVLPDAMGDIQRGLEVVEFACGIPHAQKGEYTENAGTGIDVYSMRQPLGVVAGVTPFNFPAMIPMWMFGIAVAVGNTFILKPSEKDPSVPVRLAELLLEAGAPEGVLQVVHGDKEVVDAIIQHPDINAVSFVGSSDIAHSVYRGCAAAGKRVQAMGGAKNHGIVMPDADMSLVVDSVIGAAYGAAGERCMALPVVVAVGQDTADRFVQELIPAVKKLKVGFPNDPQADYGPLITAAHKARVEEFIDAAREEGGGVLIDGRSLPIPSGSSGFFLGPTVVDYVTPEMGSYREEIFGPILQIVRVETFEEAVHLASEHQYGNGTAIFTRDGNAAREFAQRVNVGMVGINVPIPVPVSYHTFGGWKRSSFGDLNQYGMDGVRFWTKVKTVTQRWPSSTNSGESSFVIPTMA